MSVLREYTFVFVGRFECLPFENRSMNYPRMLMYNTAEFMAEFMTTPKCKIPEDSKHMLANTVGTAVIIIRTHGLIPIPIFEEQDELLSKTVFRYRPYVEHLFVLANAPTGDICRGEIGEKHTIKNYSDVIAESFNEYTRSGTGANSKQLVYDFMKNTFCEQCVHTSSKTTEANQWALNKKTGLQISYVNKWSINKGYYPLMDKTNQTYIGGLEAPILRGFNGTEFRRIKDIIQMLNYKLNQPRGYLTREEILASLYGCNIQVLYLVDATCSVYTCKSYQVCSLPTTALTAEYEKQCIKGGRKKRRTRKPRKSRKTRKSRPPRTQKYT